MRDAFGGVFTTNFLLVFIFIFIAFTAISLNYAQAFRIKNNIIDFIEVNEVKNVTRAEMQSKLSEIGNILNNANYHNTCPSGLNGTYSSGRNGNAIDGYCYNGVKIVETSSQEIKGANSKIVTYMVVVPIKWNLGALNMILDLGGQSGNSEDAIYGEWVITGEARVVIKN